MKRPDNKRPFARQLADASTARAEDAAIDPTPLFVIDDVRYAPQGKHTYVDVRIVGAAILKLVSTFYDGERVVFPACLTRSDGSRWRGVDDLDDAFARAIVVALDAYERRKSSGAA